MRKLPPLARLYTFEAAARSQSFTLAAQELNITASAVSHQIRELEEHFGKTLFERRNRHVRTTFEGQRLQHSLCRVFDALRAACAEVSLPPNDEVLAVHCAPSFAIKWLGPRLPKFLQANPELNVRLTTGAEATDLSNISELDLVITYGSAPPKRHGVETISLGEERIAPLIAPTLIAAKSKASSVLQSQTLIDSTLSPVPWPEWFERQGLDMPSKPRPAFDRAAMTIAAAVDGMGIALESTRLAARELENGDLVELSSKSFKPLLRSIHFLSFRSSDLQRPLVKAFVDWISQSAFQSGKL